jgi:hypothetical protein
MKVLKFLLPFLFFFWLSCQNDELHENMASANQKHKVEQKSLKDLPLLIPVIEKMKKIRPKANTYARTTETFLGVENVITDDIYVFTDSTGYKTYSFKIDNINGTLKFENLHLIETTTGYVAYIMSYDPDPSWLEEKKLDPHNEVYLTNYIGEITKYSLEREIIYSTNENNYTTNSANGTIVECTISMVPYCTFGNHDHSNGIDTTCRGLAYTAVETCTTYFLGGSSDGESSNAGGSTNNPDPCPSGGTTGTVIVGTQPISGIGGGCTPNETIVVSLPPEDPPCVSLTKLFAPDRENIKSKINNYLKPKLNEPFEYAVNYRKYTIPEEEFFSQNEQPLSKTASLIQIGGNFYGQIHTHPVGTYPMFSWQDIYNLKDLYADAKPQNKQDVFMIIVCPNDKVYAVKVDDFNKLKTKMDGDWDSPELIGCSEVEKNDDLLNTMKKEYSKDSNSERVFLKKFKDYGISVYKADNNLTNWSKLLLDNSNSENPTVNQNPCNQN